MLYGLLRKSQMNISMIISQAYNNKSDSNPLQGLSHTTLPPPLLPIARIHFPLRNTSPRVGIQRKEAPLKVIL